MIRGVHTMFYSSEPEALRAFLRDKFRFPYTESAPSKGAEQRPAKVPGTFESFIHDRPRG
jgi:hypothetical protein